MWTSQKANAFKDSGIPITKGLGGIAEVGHYLDILSATPEFLRSLAYFIVDADHGLKNIERHLKAAELVNEKAGFKKYRIKDVPNAFLVLLPSESAVEGLFSEYPNHLQECISRIWKKDFSLRDTVPTSLSRVTAKARASSVSSKAEAMALVKNVQDVKDLFWRKVKDEGYKINTTNSTALQSLLGNK